MARYISFDYMLKDVICTRVDIGEYDNVNIVNYTDNIFDRAFGNKECVTVEDVKHLFSLRVMPRERSDCKFILQKIGVPFYDEYLICRVTNGSTTDDYNWIRFDDKKDLKWSEIKFRT